MKISLVQVIGVLVLLVAAATLGFHFATYQWVGWGVENRLLRYDPASKQFLPTVIPAEAKRRPDPTPEKKPRHPKGDVGPIGSEEQ